jgi:hypothetical protein
MTEAALCGLCVLRREDNNIVVQPRGQHLQACFYWTNIRVCMCVCVCWCVCVSWYNQASSPACRASCRSLGCERFNARRDLAHCVLDGDEGVVAVAIMTTVERLLLGLVLFFTWHDTR